jgi:ATP-dependent Clp protease ATP-binding subunit ClpC
MFERFTERARKVVVYAQDEARILGHNYIGTEHLLLGLLREEDGVAARVLESLHVTLDGVREQVARIVGRGEEPDTGQIPFTPRAKKALELALREAISHGHNWIGTEHIFLALVREGQGVAMQVLLEFGVTAEVAREAVARELPQGVRRAGRNVDVVCTPKRRLGVSPGLVAGWLLFAGALGIGIAIGWAIWG